MSDSKTRFFPPAVWAPFGMLMCLAASFLVPVARSNRDVLEAALDVSALLASGDQVELRFRARDRAAVIVVPFSPESLESLSSPYEVLGEDQDAVVTAIEVAPRSSFSVAETALCAIGAKHHAGNLLIPSHRVILRPEDGRQEDMGPYLVAEGPGIERVGCLSPLDAGARRFVHASEKLLNMFVWDLLEQGPTVYLTSGDELAKEPLLRLANQPHSNLIHLIGPPRASELLVRRLLAIREYRRTSMDNKLSPRMRALAAELRAVLELARILDKKVPNPDWFPRALAAIAFSRTSGDTLRKWAEGGADLSPIVKEATVLPACAEFLAELGSDCWPRHFSSFVSASLASFWEKAEEEMNGRDLRLLQQDRDCNEPVASVHILGNMRGVLDNCGCKVSSAGGLARAVESAGREAWTVLVCGNLFPAPGEARNQTFIISSVDTLIRELAPRTIINWGATDLYAFTRQPTLLPGMHQVSPATVNVHRPDEEEPIGRARILSIGGLDYVVIGISGCDNPIVGPGMREVLQGGFEWDDPVHAVERTLAAIPGRAPVIVLSSARTIHAPSV